MALSNTIVILIVVIVNTALFYVSAAIISSSLFASKAKKWSWINLIMGIIMALIWQFGIIDIFNGNASRVMFGILFFIICFFLWTVAGDISERRAAYAAFLTLLLWFTFCWILIIILHLFEIAMFDSLPTLFSYFT